MSFNLSGKKKFGAFTLGVLAALIGPALGIPPGTIEGLLTFIKWYLGIEGGCDLAAIARDAANARAADKASAGDAAKGAISAIIGILTLSTIQQVGG